MNLFLFNRKRVPRAVIAEHLKMSVCLSQQPCGTGTVIDFCATDEDAEAQNGVFPKAAELGDDEL